MDEPGPVDEIANAVRKREERQRVKPWVQLLIFSQRSHDELLSGVGRAMRCSVPNTGQLFIPRVAFSSAVLTMSCTCLLSLLIFAVSRENQVTHKFGSLAREQRIRIARRCIPGGMLLAF